jgi:hypothetical protein
VGDGEAYIALAFEGGGFRATSFAYGMLQELRAAGVKTGTPNGLPDQVRLVLGGSVMAARFGLFRPEGLPGVRDRFLVTDGEKYMVTSAVNPLTVIKGVAGGVNGRDLWRFAPTVDRQDLINATDLANNTPVRFSPETFDALCSDPSKVRLSKGVAASAVFPLAFAPIVLEAHQGKCDDREPDWLTSARYNPEAAAAMRARAQVPYAPLTAAEAVKLTRTLFLVANVGVEPDYSWIQEVAGPGGVNLAVSIASSAMAAASRSGAWPPV